MKKHLASLSSGSPLAPQLHQTETNHQAMRPITIHTGHSTLVIAAGIAGRATGSPYDKNEDTVFYQKGITTLCDAMGGGAPLNETIITMLKAGLSLEEIARHPDITGHYCGSHTCLNQIHVTPLSDIPKVTTPPEQLEHYNPDMRLDETLQTRIYNHVRSQLNEQAVPRFPLLFNPSLSQKLITELKPKHFKTLADVINFLDICTHHHNLNNQVAECIGATSPSPMIHTTQLIAQAGETLITSSDGILDNLTPEQISTIYQAFGTPD